jgi:hypothetical protein
MQDHKLSEIVTEIHKELPKGVPKFVVSAICRHFLKRMFRIMAQDKSRIALKKCDVMQIYQDYNIEYETNKLKDLDETREAKTTPPVFRRNRYPKRVHYPRLGPTAIYKSIGK